MKYWNTKLKQMSEYLPGEQPKDFNEFIKLNTNENPFPPSNNILNAIKEACSESLRLYPDPESLSLRDLFAKENGLNAENIFAGNGSDEIFTLVFRGFIDDNEVAAFPYPAYSLYYTMAEANGIRYEKIPLTASLDVDLNIFLKKKYGLIIIGNPNNPTGKGVDANLIRKFLEKYKGLLVVDEAYVDFYNETAIKLIKDFDNVIITRSFSKSYSLAGLRVGLAIACKDIIKGFFKLKDSYNIDRLAEAGAKAALLDKKNFKYNIEMLINNKQYLEERLSELEFEIVPSTANFILVKNKKIPSKELYRELKERKILVRYFEGPVQSEYVRITVGKMMDMKTLANEIKSILGV
jgi:histidinol-phosphate aminotransferase